MKCRLCASDNTVLRYSGDKVSELSHEHFSVTKAPLVKCDVSYCPNCGITFNSSSVEDLSLYEDVVDAGYEETAQERKLEFSKALDECEKLTGEAIQGKSLLDVGCMTGVLLEAAKSKGAARLKGVEPSEWAARICKDKGFDVFCGFLGSEQDTGERYDIVTAFDVIEHVPHPLEFLERLNHLLTDGGILVLTTPDIDSIYGKLMGRRYWFIEMMHLFYFSPKTLSALVVQSGFDITTVKRHMKSLRFGYFMQRLGGLFGPLGALFEGIGKIPGLENRVVNFYAGQMMLVARKKSHIGGRGE